MKKRALGPEFQKIEEMTRHLPTASQSVLVGIGDDAAVLKSPNSNLLLCSDLMIENVHFRRDWATPQEIGFKAIARALSDIAAMNGKPLYALVSIALADSNSNFHVELYKGIARASSEFKVEVVGGDLSRSPSGNFIDVSVVGEASNPYRRHGCRPGDLVVVSGELGASAAGLHSLEQGLKEDPRWSLLRRLHLLPQPRFDILKKLDQSGLVTSMIDISDSLVSELFHLAELSGVGFELMEDALPIHPAAVEYAEKFHLSSVDLALHGGEDYQLLFTVDPELWDAYSLSQSETFHSAFHVIGVATPQHLSVVLLDQKNNSTELSIKGWDHFKNL